MKFVIIFVSLFHFAFLVNAICDRRLDSEENHRCSQKFAEDLVSAQQEDNEIESYRLQCCAFDRAAFCLREAEQHSECSITDSQMETTLAGFHLQIGEKDCSRYGPETCGAGNVVSAVGLILTALVLSKWVFYY
ncbi:uncharacterized protein LOC143246106 [Tachypleus tridentatus]|uniref:uncharacterized protein LOC143246106 n=1 Tax=Tachypleus tridentatus TaxID=6853 RepID=UPI003FD0ABEC